MQQNPAQVNPTQQNPTSVPEQQQFQQPQQNPQQLQQNPQQPQQNPQQLQQNPQQPQQNPQQLQQNPQQAPPKQAPYQGVIPQQPTEQGTPQQPQQQAGAPAAQQSASSYTPGTPFAVGVPAGAEAYGGSQLQQPQQQGAPAAGAYAGTQGLTSQPSELYPEAFADHLSPKARDCLDDCIDVSQVAAWCSDRCLEQGPGMAQCSRLCNEASTLGSVTAEFIARDSLNTPPIVEAFVDTAERTIDELGKFDSPHTNEAEMVIDRAIDSSLDMLDQR